MAASSLLIADLKAPILSVARGFLVCLWLCGFFSLSYEARSGVAKQEFQVKKHVNSLNKPVIKNFQTPDGDITDYVPITKRPAFDHHFLKDHMTQFFLQMKHKTVQFPKSAEPDLINPSGHQLKWKG